MVVLAVNWCRRGSSKYKIFNNRFRRLKVPGTRKLFEITRRSTMAMPVAFLPVAFLPVVSGHCLPLRPKHSPPQPISRCSVRVYNSVLLEITKLGIRVQVGSRRHAVPPCWLSRFKFYVPSGYKIIRRGGEEGELIAFGLEPPPPLLPHIVLFRCRINTVGSN